MTTLLVRLDDACPTMDQDRWQAIEIILDELDIKPLVAVVPKNKDPNLNRSNADDLFWDKVRDWQDKGWDIALHGYDHLYISNKRGLVPFNDFSEFSGVSYGRQKKKILDAMKVFSNENISTHIWVAPAHSFDEVTLEVLKKFTDIDVISDGISYRCYSYLGFKWIPQTLWKAKKTGMGINTICYHPNEMSAERLSIEKERLSSMVNNITTFNNVYHSCDFNSRNIMDQSYEKYYFLKSSIIKKIVSMITTCKKVMK